MKKIYGVKKYKKRKMYMVNSKIKTKDLLKELMECSTDDWTELCNNCATLIEEAQMTNEDIDNIVESVKKENG